MSAGGKKDTWTVTEKVADDKNRRIDSMREEKTVKKASIVNFDENSSIRAYDFTSIAIQEFYDTIDSEQFATDNEEKIFEFLTGEMEIVSFQDHLKRYLYQKAGLKEPYLSVSNYPELILQAFERNGCLDAADAKEKQALRRQARRWLTSETVKRDTVFWIGFGLDMSERDISKFLTLVLKETDFDFYNPAEVIFWHCRHAGKTWTEAQRMQEQYAQLQADPTLRAGHKWQAMKQDPKLYIAAEEGLWEYLRYLKQLNIADQKETKAKQVFQKMYQKAQEVAAAHLNRYPDQEGARELAPSDITPGKIESILYSGVPVTKTGNLMSFAKLKKQFQSRRLNRARLNELLGGKPVERFDLITLMFFLFALDEEKLAMHAGFRFRSFVDETNEQLTQAEMIGLYPVNPYEAFVLMCMVSEDPLDTFASVWEKSYDE